MLYHDRRLRHELKYPISEGTAELLRQRLRAVMREDSHASGGKYRITSLYFDDVFRSAYNDKLLGCEVRKKYRVRAYNLDPSRISLECKYKDNDYVSKRGALLTREEYGRMLRGDYLFGREERFADTVMEDFLLSDSAVRLKPAFLVDYMREPFVCREGNVRITLDSRISTSVNSLDMFDPKTAYTLVGESTVLEVKYDDYIPSYIEGILGGLGLNRESVSKFMLAADCHNGTRRIFGF